MPRIDPNRIIYTHQLASSREYFWQNVAAKVIAELVCFEYRNLSSELFQEYEGGEAIPLHQQEINTKILRKISHIAFEVADVAVMAHGPDGFKTPIEEI